MRKWVLFEDQITQGSYNKLTAFPAGPVVGEAGVCSGSRFRLQTGLLFLEARSAKPFSGARTREHLRVKATGPLVNAVWARSREVSGYITSRAWLLPSNCSSCKTLLAESVVLLYSGLELQRFPVAGRRHHGPAILLEVNLIAFDYDFVLARHQSFSIYRRLACPIEWFSFPFDFRFGTSRCEKA